MELQEKIKTAILKFIGNNYGENEEDACYSVEALASCIASALTETPDPEKKPEPGRRIVCLHMNDDPRPIPDGMTGTIDFIDDIGDIHVSWDNGRFLALVPGVDEFELL